MRENTPSNFREYLLSELRCAAIRTRLMTAEINSIGVALRGNFITTNDAIEWLHECGVLGLVAMSSAITCASS